MGTHIRHDRWRARYVVVGAAAILLASAGFLGMSLVLGSTFEQSREYSMTVDEQAASSVLGAPLPRITWMPAGLVRSALTVDPVPEPIGNLPMPRFVYQSYSMTFENVALLKVNRGKLGRVGGGEALLPSGERLAIPEPQRVRIGGADPLVATAKLPGGADLVSYFLERDGFVIQLDVKLSPALDRTTTDRMFASIR